MIFMKEKKCTKDSIILTGIKLFARNNYNEVSVDSIVEKAGISKGAFYYYFKSKDDFYNEILKTAYKNFTDTYLIESKNTKTEKDRLHAFVRAIFYTFEKDKDLFLVIQKEIVKIVTGENSPFLDYQKKIFELLKDILKDREDILCFFIMGILRSAIIYHLKTNEPLTKIIEDSWFYISKIVFS
jgi:AcrR family transcriptional regulator